MKKRDAYHPDYLNMYPCLKERPDILKFLKQCDRKQEYLEYDLKVNRARTNKRTMETVIWPQRELSYEHLLEEHQFAQQEPSPEETLLHEIELENQRCAVERLPNDERLLLHLRYWCDFSQAEIARHLGVTQQSVSYQERCILRKLKKLLNDIQKTEDKIAELQEHLKRQNTLRQQMEDIEIIKSFRSMKLDSRSLLVLLDGIQKGTVTIQMDEDGGITVEDAKAPQKKENNAEVHRPPVGQMTEREVLDDEE